MLWFWLGITLLLAIACLFIFIPIFQHTVLDQQTRQQLNINLYKTQLQELDEELAKGDLTADAYQVRRQELEQRLLQDIPVVAEQTVIASKPSWLMKFFLSGLLIIASLLLYHHWGASQQLATALQIQQQTAEVAQLRNQLGTPEQIEARLQARLQQNPNSAQGWYLLGRLYFSTNNFNQATLAFAKAYQLQANNPDIMLQYAQVLFLSNETSAKDLAAKLVQQLLNKQPGNPQVLNLQALIAYEHADYLTAIHIWEGLLKIYPPGTPENDDLLQAIAKAQQQLAKSKKLP